MQRVESTVQSYLFNTKQPHLGGHIMSNGGHFI